jgi:hypothetical protein
MECDSGRAEDCDERGLHNVSLILRGEIGFRSCVTQAKCHEFVRLLPCFSRALAPLSAESRHKLKLIRSHQLHRRQWFIVAGSRAEKE